jgi:hypothetical protein
MLAQPDPVSMRSIACNEPPGPGRGSRGLFHLAEAAAMTLAERFILDLIRRKTNFRNFTLTLSVDGDNWRATLSDHDTGATLGGKTSQSIDEALKLARRSDMR